MKSSLTRVLLLATTLCASCSGSGGGQIPLSQCLTGWYLQPPSVACTPGTCGSSMPPPECSSSDCTHWSFEGFLDNGVYYFGVFSYSAQSMSMSGIATKQTWAPTSNGYSIVMKSTSTVDSCTATQMSADKKIVIRPPANLSAALDQATAGGATTWTHVSVGP